MELVIRIGEGQINSGIFSVLKSFAIKMQHAGIGWCVAVIGFK